jgi:hypothetical protein
MEAKGLDDDNLQEVKEKLEVKPEVIKWQDIYSQPYKNRDVYRIAYILQYIPRFLPQFRFATRTRTSEETSLIKLAEMYKSYRKDPTIAQPEPLQELFDEIYHIMNGLKRNKRNTYSKNEYDFNELYDCNFNKFETYPTLASSFAILNLTKGPHDNYKLIVKLDVDHFKTVLDFADADAVFNISMILYEYMQHVTDVHKKVKILSTHVHWAICKQKLRSNRHETILWYFHLIIFGVHGTLILIDDKDMPVYSDNVKLLLCGQGLLANCADIVHVIGITNYLITPERIKSIIDQNLTFRQVFESMELTDTDMLQLKKLFR